MKNAFHSLLLVGTLAAAPAVASAQTPAAPATPATPAAAGSLSGTVADSLSRRGLAFATVILRPAADAQNPLSTMTTESGAYRFDRVPAGPYTLQVQYIGYKASAPVALAVAGATTAAPVALVSDQKLLAGVTVTATKAFIEQRADKLVMNVAASPIAAGGTAADVLSRAPGVLEQNGGYVLRGKRVAVLLDGKYTNLSGDELKNMLSAMPASTLAQVEIIANPSAKYDAAGGAVINIVSTKSKKLGTNGVATTGVGQGTYGRYNAGLSLNHRTAKLNVYGGLDRLSNQVTATTRATRAVGGETAIEEFGQEVRANRNNTGRLGLDYTISKNASAGVLVRGMWNERTRSGSNLTQLETGNTGLTQTSIATITGRARFLSPAVNAYFKTKLDTLGKELRVNADYFGYDKAWSNRFTTRYYDATYTETGPADLLRDNSPANNSVKSVSADYSQPLYKGTLEAGLKTTFTTTDNDIRWEKATDGQPWTNDAGKTNHFIYRENINAAYGTFSRKVQKVDVRLGLRAEQTNTDGTSLTTGQTTKRSYLNFFPSVSAQYNRSEKLQLGFAYNRKIDRFRFGIVNPFVTYISQYRYAQGNPSIRPSYSHNFELTHAYNSLLTTSLSYGRHTDVLTETYDRNDVTQVVVSSYRNFRNATTLDASTTLMKPLFGKKWNTVTTLGVTYAKIDAQSGSIGLNTARPSAYLNSNHTLTLPKGFKAEVSAQYMSPMTFGGVAFASRYSTGFGITKSVLKDAGTLTLNVSDAFNTQQNGYRVLSNGINSTNVDKAETRFVKLNFSYKVGNKNVKGSQRRSTGIEAEKSRMDN